MTGGRLPFLSTLSAGRAQWRAAWGVVFVSVCVFAAAAPFAKVALPQVPMFLPIQQSALVLVDAITMLLLLGQYAILRCRELLVLACAYLFSGLMAVAHALSFPGLFAPEGLLGGGQVTAWIYFLWHAGFPCFVIAYALLKPRSDVPAPVNAPVRAELALGLAGTAAAVVLLVGFAGHLASRIPLMAGDADAHAKGLVALATWLLGLAAMALLWMRRTHSVIDLWLMVVLCVWAADTALAAVFNGARYDLGWYLGRVYGLLASSFILGVLLLENSMLYARLVEANEVQRRRAAELLRLSVELEAANRDLDAFAGGLAHDLQQPITTIGAFAQVIERQSGHLIPEGNATHLRRIIAAAGAAHAMIRGLLEFARLGQREIARTAVDLNLVVREARQAVVVDSGDEDIEWAIGPLPVVRGDPSLLLLAVVNLLSNAVKYTRGRPNRQVRVEAQPDGSGMHRVCVADNGIGFAMADAANLFRPFERLHRGTAYEGTGMGLANVRRIVERHGGTVDFESAPDRGARFILVLPAAASELSSTIHHQLP